MRITAAVSHAGSPAPKLEEVELADPREDEILVRITATGICHTDLHAHAGIGWPGPKPSVLGHEGAGVVEKVGSAVTHVKPGDKVVLSGASCGQCSPCLAGTPTYCREAMPRSFGCRRSDGTSALMQDGEPVGSHFFAQSSFATYAIAQARGAVPVPDDVPLDILAPLGCGIITGAGAVMEGLQVRPGQSLVVFGAGSVGLAAVMAARIAGATTIVAVDVLADRCKLALELGATHSVDASANDPVEEIRRILPGGADFSFNTTVSAAVFTQGLKVLGNRGVAGFVTRPRGEWTPDMMDMLAGGKTLTGILGGSANPRLFIPKLIDFWRQGRFPLEKLIARYSFKDFDQAWDDCEAARVVKPVLVMEES
ncbi:NAD(P)-dependent alcohol dehydrogenase [Altericroceibacterium xinjiangense]|uniref:NAD(P)-dependent alcohol dehydrogenase n=1 Tax=Altericroceibacterium xinjiangense TaxID=762261 RepID=UPI000F7DDC9F|nr:NAD(P)-dependent alcohol dehydrogenase [Altericroceibacterium xinjiangense]